MKILSKLKSFLYAIPFGMKAADKEIMSGEPLPSGGVTIEVGQEVNEQRVSKHLLKGEITQEVEELRYRTYKVDEESRNYEVVKGSDGITTTIKKEKKILAPHIHKFRQENKINVTTVLEEMERVGNYGTETYFIECSYDDFVRFKIEQFITHVDVDINDKEKLILMKIYFNDQPTPYNTKSKPFVNELSRLKSIDVSNKTALQKFDFFDSLNTLGFSTYKATNEDDFVNYAFTNPTITQVEQENGYYIISVKWEEYVRFPLNASEKYYSESMDKKYQSGEKKDVEIHLVDIQERHFCEACGNEVNERDYQILLADKKPILCNACLKKMMG